MADVVEVDLFSDYICPWCYMASGCIKRLMDAYRVRFRWRPHPLNPDIPDDGVLLKDVIDAPPEKIRQMDEKLSRAAADAGLRFCGPEKIYNTRLAQEVGAWAESLGRGMAFHHAAYGAYFGAGKNLFDKKVLMELVASIGLSPDEAVGCLEKRSFKSAVDADWAFSKQMNIVMIPTYMLNGNRLVGIQSYVKLARFLEKNGVGKRSN